MVKSFADKVTIDIKDGITDSRPNGSGKIQGCC